MNLALIIEAEFVGKPALGQAHTNVFTCARVRDMGAHFLGASAQLKPTDKGEDGAPMPEPAGVWPDASSRTIRDGAGDHHRNVDALRLAQFIDGEQRRLGIERVENGLDQEYVDATVHEVCGLRAISLSQLIERYGAVRGVVDVGRHGRRTIGRPDGTGDKARAAVFLFRKFRRLAHEPRALSSGTNASMP
jgi:hypothetical protein